MLMRLITTLRALLSLPEAAAARCRWLTPLHAAAFIRFIDVGDCHADCHFELLIASFSLHCHRFLLLLAAPLAIFLFILQPDPP